MLSRSAILRDAHSRTRWARARVDCIHGKHDPYRVIFAWCIREAWQAARQMVREAVSNAALSHLEEVEDADPTNILARIDALRAYAGTLPPTSDGRRKILADADDLAQAARAMMIPAFQDHAHAAH